MRILIVSSNDEEIGGVASVIRNLAEYMIGQGDEVFILNSAKTIFLKRKTTKLGFPGFDHRLQMPFGDRNPVFSLLAFLVLFPIGIWEILRLIHRYKIDVINIHCPTGCFFYFAICKRIFRVPLITSIHGADVFPDGNLEVKHVWSLKFLLRSSDLIVAPSRGFRKIFLSAFPQLQQKTTFIYNGVNLGELNGFHTEAVSDNQLAYILCISAYKEQKAVDVLIRAFKHVQEADSSLKLVIVGAGAGPLREQLEELALSLGLQDGIKFLGPKGRADVARLLHGCELFVLPSRFETFGIVILEAMACEKPVVATAVGGIPEIIENGSNGILVEPDNPDALAEALITVLKNRTLRLTIAKNGCATVHGRFRSEIMGSSYATAFRDLLTSRPNVKLFARPRDL